MTFDHAGNLGSLLCPSSGPHPPCQEEEKPRSQSQSQCCGFDALAWGGGSLPGIRAGPSLPLELLSVTRPRCGRDKRMGSRRDQAGAPGLLGSEAPGIFMAGKGD